MTFLNPAVLIGLLAAAFPLILHLLNLRRLRVVEFSTLTFLKELQKSTLRRLKFQYWLLLILRTLLIVFVVLAFARPVLRGTFAPGIGSRSATSMVIILDDSYSMGRSDDHGVLFSQAKNRAGELLSMLREGDDGLLLKLSDGGSTTFDAPTQNVNLLKSLVAHASLSAVHRPFDDPLRLAARLLQKSTNPNKEVYVLSDMQTGNVQAQPDSASLGSMFHHDVSMFLVRFGSPVPNAAVTDTRVENTLLDLGHPISVSATVRNFGSEPLRAFVVSAYLENSRVQQKTVDLAPHQSAALEFPILPRHRGVNRGSIRIEDDQCDYDNVRCFCADIPEAIRVMLVSHNGDDLRYIRTALGLSQSTDRTSLFSISSIQWSGLTGAALRDANVVVCSIAKETTGDALLRLKEYADAGGMLVVVPSPSVQPDVIRHAASILNLAGIDSIRGDANNRDVFQTIVHTDFRHPIFNGMFERQDREPAGRGGGMRLSDAPKIYRSISIRPTPRANMLMTQSDGDGFLAEYPSGEGRVLVFSVPATPDWSDFPLKGIFVPLIYRSMLYSERTSPGENALCGDRITFTIPETAPHGQSSWSIMAPDSDATIVKPAPNVKTHSLSAGVTAEMEGVYLLYQGKELLDARAVNLDPKESDLTPIDESNLRRHFSEYGIAGERIREFPPAADIRTAVLESRYGVELWRAALIAAAICALLELFVAHLSKRYARQEQT